MIVMRYLIGLTCLLLLNSCYDESSKPSSTDVNINYNEIRLKHDIAIKFINEYAKFCTSNTEITEYSKWIEQHQLLTDSFKNSYNTIIDLAKTSNNETGLEFDPIFDAQDFPEAGFIIDSLKMDSGYFAVKGKNWSDFKLVLKVISKNNKMLVDGAGVINIPIYKRAKR